MNIVGDQHTTPRIPPRKQGLLQAFKTMTEKNYSDFFKLPPQRLRTIPANKPAKKALTTPPTHSTHLTGPVAKLQKTRPKASKILQQQPNPAVGKSSKPELTQSEDRKKLKEKFSVLRSPKMRKTQSSATTTKSVQQTAPRSLTTTHPTGDAARHQDPRLQTTTATHFSQRTSSPEISSSQGEV